MIRQEAPTDGAVIRRVHLESFPTAAEADLVDQLRKDGDVAISLVTEMDTAVTAHVLFSPMAAPFRALSLGPVAVLPAYRRRGLAAGLIQAGLVQAAAQGWDAVFVLGDRAYYERFGFDTGLASGFATPYAGPHFLAKPLQNDLPILHGRLDHAPAFAGLG
ncbi:MAG TPA: N-acetyltransferase [Rhizomicrobium sp.]|nr:N-acetyltransferase [Rhizomicrobium sp.]